MAGGNFTFVINAQAIAVGLCFANGLSPITSKYGWFWGMVAAVMHYFLVTSVPNLHGGFCLYNGGFTAAVIWYPPGAGSGVLLQNQGRAQGAEGRKIVKMVLGQEWIFLPQHEKGRKAA